MQRESQRRLIGLYVRMYACICVYVRMSEFAADSKYCIASRYIVPTSAWQTTTAKQIHTYSGIVVHTLTYTHMRYTLECAKNTFIFIP